MIEIGLVDRRACEAVLDVYVDVVPPHAQAGLLAIGLIVVSFVVTSLLYSHMMGQIDSQLRTTSDRARSSLIDILGVCLHRSSLRSTRKPVRPWASASFTKSGLFIGVAE